MRVDVLRIYTDASAEGLRGVHVVVFDILRATTSIAHFLAAGVRAVIPVVGPAEAFALRHELAGGASGPLILAGEESGLPIPGFDFGNSPVEIDRTDLGGATVVLSTTNGTKALRHCRGAERLYAGSFNNGPALVGHLLGTAPERVVLACSGDRGGYSPEDHWGAGLFAGRLMEAGAEAGEGAEEAAQAWLAAAAEPFAAFGGTPHGEELLGYGFEEDLASAAIIGSHDVVPEMVGREVVSRSAPARPGGSTG